MDPKQYYIERYTDVYGDFRWRAMSQDGRVIAASGGMGFADPDKCVDDIRTLVAFAVTAPWFHKEKDGQLTPLN